MNRRLAISSSSLAIVFLLSACGGGGVNSTPPPPTPTPTPPPTTANTDLLSLADSERFTNDAARVTGTVPTNGSVGTTDATATEVTIDYSASDKSYTITTAGSTQTFRPSDIDPTRSSAAATVYIRTNGNTADVLTLTKPGTSGRITYQYVAGGFWERTATGTNSVVGSGDAFAYGVETPDAATPRTGAANYDIDMIGVMGLPNANPYAISGGGTLYVDFGKGTIVITGETTASGVFNGTATLANAANGFSGRFEYYDFGTFRGGIDGRFFGPNAQEVGAAWHVADTSGRSAAGVIIGRRDSGAATQNSDFADLANGQFFDNSGVTLKATYSGGANGGTDRSTQSSEFLVHYDKEYDSYTIVAGDKAEFFGPDISNTGSAPGSYWSKPYGTTQSTLSLNDMRKYVASGEYRFTDGVGGSTLLTSNYFVYGFPTDNAGLVRSGIGIYKTGISGSMTDQRYDGLLDMAGPGFVQIDLGTGAIDLTGSFDIIHRPLTGPQTVGTGSYSGTGTLSSSANAFSGAVELNGLDVYEGSFAGHFYGPDGEEIGATFTAADSGGDVAIGTITGELDPTANASTRALADLTETTVFVGSKAEVGMRHDMSSERVFSLGLPNVTSINHEPQIIYDPAAQTYTIRELGGTYYDTFYTRIAIGPADKNPAASNAEYDAYQVMKFDAAAGDSVTDVKLFRAARDNPTFQLTYSSFINLKSLTIEPGPTEVRTTRYAYFGIGTPTSQTLMPRSGTASYSGLATGYGTVEGVDFSQYNVSGTSSMSINFSTLAAQMNLSLAGQNIADGTNSDLGDYIFNGNLGYVDVDGKIVNFLGLALQTDGFGPASMGEAFGHLYGPEGQEYVTPFGILLRDLDGTKTTIGGVAFGKKD